MSVSACIHLVVPFRQWAAVAFSNAIQPEYFCADEERVSGGGNMVLCDTAGNKCIMLHVY